MLKRTEPSRGGRRRPGVPAALLVFALLLVASVAVARQDGGGAGAVERSPAAGRAAEIARNASLAAEIEARYEVLPARDGLVLRPRLAGSNVLAIEVSDGEVAIDGEPASRSEVRRKLGDGADAVLRLADLEPAVARALFHVGGAEPPRPEAPPAPVPPAPPSGAVAPVPPTGPAPPLPPEPPRARIGQRVSILNSVEVGAGELAEQAVSVGGSVTVDGEVEEDAVSVGGTARINGRVHGDVVAVGGSVYLGPQADVGGDVVCVGGKIHREDGARVGGEATEVAAAGSLFGGRPWPRGWSHFGTNRWFRWDEAWDVVTDVIRFIVLLLLAWLVVLVAQRPVGRIQERAALDPWRAGLAGLLSWVLFLPLLFLVVVVLAISIIGIPLLILIPVVIFVFLVGLLVGYAAVAGAVGRWLEGRFGWRVGNAFLAVLVGMVAIEGWSIAADVLDVIAGPIPFVASATMVFGLVVRFAAWTVGLGAVVLSRFGAAPRTAAASSAPPPPLPPPVEPEPYA
jgi:hypothetical protein